MTHPLPLNAAADMPRMDYPRPQFVRNSWLCLNGDWQFAFDFGVSGEARGMVEGGEYPLTIRVPFCPESRLSGIGHIDFIPAVWYRRTFTLDQIPQGRALLHFGAVDYDCKVWVNGQLCGTHKGGYTSFVLDITAALKSGENTLVVFAKDDLRSGHQAVGKQCDEYISRACSYTRTTGIWQTVWLEFVADRYIAHTQMIPHAADGTLDTQIHVNKPAYGDVIRMTASYQSKPVGSGQAHVSGTLAQVHLSVSEIHLWNPGKPEIYDLTIELVDGKTGEVLDSAESYFALRDVALTEKALTINGKPVFMRTILDQGFNAEGIYTAPNDEFLKKDIELAMDLGFNGARFHQRVFEPRSLYWADQLGYIVWGEHAGGVDLSSAQAIEDFLPEWMESIRRDFNHPSIIGWACLNETYHSMVLDPENHKVLYQVTKAMDPTRPVIDASGGMHYETDMFDVHDYEQDPQKLADYLAPMLEDPKAFHNPVYRYVGNKPRRPMDYKGQPYWVSEYGGTHWNPRDNRSDGWGYGNDPRTEEEFTSRYEGLTHVLLSHPRVCGFCYTQLTDIEQEENGLYYYDRTRKLPDWAYDRIRAANLEKASIEEE